MAEGRWQTWGHGSTAWNRRRASPLASQRHSAGTPTSSVSLLATPATSSMC